MRGIFFRENFWRKKKVGPKMIRIEFKTFFDFWKMLIFSKDFFFKCVCFFFGFSETQKIPGNSALFWYIFITLTVFVLTKRVDRGEAEGDNVPREAGNTL